MQLFKRTLNCDTQLVTSGVRTQVQSAACSVPGGITSIDPTNQLPVLYIYERGKTTT